MDLIELLKIMSETSYMDFEGNEFKIKLKKELNFDEIEAFKKHIPKRNLNEDYKRLLQFSSGFEIPKGFIEEICFDNLSGFGFEELIQFNLNLTDDGTGNYWIQEINQKGEWGKIYYVCHDPAVMIKQADSLFEFLQQIHEYLLKKESSYFSRIINEISGKIYFSKGRLLEQKEALESSDELLSTFASKYNEDWFIADLRNAKNGEGFRLEACYKETIRLEDELIWALKKRKSFWTRIKEKFK